MKNFGLLKWIHKKSTRTDAHPLGRRQKQRFTPESGTKVLIVDDSRTVRSVLAKMLRQSGYDVLEAEDGSKGIEMATKQRPDLIFMDVIMPQINGFQATRRIKREQITKNIPIIMMTGNKESAESFWTKKIGATSYLTKPFSRQEIFAQVESVLYQSMVA